jgi:hypothetical protein
MTPPQRKSSDILQEVNTAKFSYKLALWIAASAATFNGLKNGGFSP